MTDDSEDGKTQNPESDQKAYESVRCSVAGEVVEGVPADAPVVSASTANVSETSALARVFDAVHSVDADKTTVQRPSGEYEKVSVAPDSVEEQDAVMDELQRHPQYDNDDYPAGVYIDDGDLVLAVSIDCLTG